MRRYSLRALAATSALSLGLTLAVAGAAPASFAAMVPASPAVPLAAANTITDPGSGALSLAPLGSYETGAFEKSAAEIVEAWGDRLFVVNALAGKVDVLDYRNPKAIAKLFDIASTGTANSVAVRADGLGVVAFESTTKTDAGHLLFFDANAKDAASATLGTVTVGALPDMVTFSPDGRSVLVANEGEPAADFSIDPEGSVGVVAVPAAVAAPKQSDVRLADFHAFEQGGTLTLPADVRIFGPRPHGDDHPVSRNLEPEYITAQGGTAYVTLQEANAVAAVDIATARVTSILPLGFKDLGVAGQGIDPSDKDGKASIRTVAGLYGMYQPDGIASYQAAGTTYLVTANEGDSRAWGSYTEDVRVKSLAKDGYGPVCASSPLSKLTGDNDLGRLKVTRELGYNATSKCYDKLYSFGGRSFSIWTSDGTRVFDSGDAFEQLTAKLPGVVFNSDHAAVALDDRSDDKGPEPESVVIGTLSGRTYAFVGFERVGGIAVYDITNPKAPTYVTYVNNRDFAVKDASKDASRLSAAGDLGPEGLAFIPAEDSATGTPLLAVGNEVSGTTTLFQITDLLAPKTIDILTINDFHGRLAADASRDTAAGAAVLAGAVKQWRAKNPDTLFVSAGDNIGASTFDSFIAKDNPTIDALKAATLDLSAVGNHEFDQGFTDLTKRVIPRYDAGNTTGKSDYALGANVYDASGKPALKEYTVRTIDGVRVAFIGTVTETTPQKVTPTGIQGLTFGSQLEAANRVAAGITERKEADAIVLLTHEGLDASDCGLLTGDSTFAKLARGASPAINAIVSADSHQKYSCEGTIDGAPGKKRPVIQAFQYGTNLGHIQLSVDRKTNTLLSAAGSLVPLVQGGKLLYPADADTAAIVKSAVDNAATEGNKVVGSITAPITRAGNPPGSDRGAESSLSNLLADMYVWATSRASYAGTKAQIGIMNPGGVRADLIPAADGTITYRQVATVQPFANTLVTVTLTGAQLRQVLEEQWRDGTKLHLGISGFTYTYQPTAAQGSRITSITFQGAPVRDDQRFTVVTNSFIAAGGDGFTTFTKSTDKRDTGQVDLQASVEFFAANTPVAPASSNRTTVGDGVVTPTPQPTTQPTFPTTGGEPAAPTTPPAAVAANALTSTYQALRGAITPSTTTPTAGAEVRIFVGADRAGTWVHVYAYSTPRSLGWHQVDSAGFVTVTIPADLAGTHRLVVQDASGALIGWQQVTVRALAATGGVSPAPWAAAGALLLLAGGALVATRRRGRGAQV